MTTPHSTTPATARGWESPAAERACVVCHKPAAALTANGRCAPCRRAEVQRNKVAAAVSRKRARNRGRIA